MHRVTLLAPLLAAISALSLALSCSSTPDAAAPQGGPLGDHAAPPRLATVEAPVTCGASLARYPVAGKHNGGWDTNALAYTCPAHPTSSKDNSDFIAGDHFGNDIFAAKGTPLVACVSGTIVGKSTTTIGGNNVSIKDACGWHYYYAHLDTFAAGLAVGQTIAAGAPIGTVGNTGNASGTSPHLHFSIHPANYEAGIDPFPLLQTVDATSCAPGPTTPPGVNPATPNISISSSTSATDVYTAGPSAGVGDAFEGKTFTVDVVVSNAAGGKNTPDYVRLGYWLESPYVELVTWVIQTDWPAKDKASWVTNDADSAPDNPSKTSPPSTGQLNLYAMAQGESKRVRFTVRALKYSLGVVDHPDLRAWIWHVGSYYGEMSGWDDPVEVNLAGKLLRTYVQQDVYGLTHWEWNGAAQETEGWAAGNAVSVAVDTGAHALGVDQLGADPSVVSPALSLDPSVYKGFRARVRHADGTKPSQLFWSTAAAAGFAEERSIAFESPGDGDWHEITINLSAHPGWAGTITRVRLDPTWAETGRYDLDWLAAVKDPGPTSGDQDGDGKLASADCNDLDPNVNSPNSTPEVCDGVDNDCDGETDEGLSSGPEVCDGVDSNCNGTLMPGEEDADLDGYAPCNGDCDDNDATVHPGADELCDLRDNDCDQAVDEGFSVGAACAVGVGACKATGVVACSDDGGLTCSAVAGTPTVELCNGEDDDCDGGTDEDWGLGGPCSAGGLGCLRVGVTRCSPDGLFICDAMPPSPLPEVCNGVDDDCDGYTDEGIPVGDACRVGVGACEAEGITGCSSEGLTCLAEPGTPSAERCNGIDDDCDGLTDDGFPLGEPCQVIGDGCVGDGEWVCGPSETKVACEASCEPGQPGGDDVSWATDGDVSEGAADAASGVSGDAQGADAGGLASNGQGAADSSGGLGGLGGLSGSGGVSDSAGGCGLSRGPASVPLTLSHLLAVLAVLALLGLSRRRPTHGRPG